MNQFLSHRLGGVLLLLVSLVTPVRAALPPEPLNAVTSGNGTWLAMGDGGIILRSSDALYWTNQPSLTTNTLWGATFGAGQFVAVGVNGTILTSPDGAAWTQRNSSTTRTLRSATYGLGQFIAVGDQGALLSSTNGTTWTNRFSPNTNQWADVTFGAGVFAAVGARTGTNAGVVFFSTNGVNWSTAATIPGYPLTGVTYGNGVFVALGQNAIVMRSTNGINWQQSFSGIYQPRLRLTYGDGRFVAVNDTYAQSYISTNILEWSGAFLPISAWMRGVAFAGGRFVAVGYDAHGDGAILVSSDGMRWSDALSPYFAPIISSQPQGIEVTAGADAGLYVGVVGNPLPTLQWRLNGNDIPGKTEEFLDIPQATSSQAGDYTVVARNPFGAVTSLVATVSIFLKAPEFYGQPVDVEVALGGGFALYTSIDASPPATLQWYFGFVPLPGQTNDVLAFDDVTALYSGTYFVVASNLAGVSTSRVASVTVVPLRFSVQPFSEFGISGSVIQLNAEAEGVAPLRYQWFFNGAPLTGASNSFLIRSPLTTNDAGNYFVVASNAFGAITSQVAILGVDRMAPVIASQPEGLTAPADSFIGIAVYAVGSPQLFYQWRKNGVPIPGAINFSFEFPALRTSDAGGYDVVVRNNFGSVTSTVATLTVTTTRPRFSYEPQAMTVRVGDTAYFSVSADGAPQPRYEWRRNGVSLPGQTTASLILPAVSFSDAGDFTVVARNSVGSITSRVARLIVYGVPPYFNDQPSDQQVLAGDYVILQFGADGAPWPEFQWYFNGVPLPGANQSYLSLPEINTNQAGVYAAVASNILGVAVSRMVTVTVGMKAPTFVQQPSSQTVLWGEPVYFYSQASGGPPPVYQWLFNGVPVPDATNATFGFNFAAPTHSGSYRVIASNIVGVATSAVAVLTVNAQAPVFTSQPSSRAVLWGEVVGFSGAASGGPSPGYQWLFNGQPLPGATNNFLSLGAVSPMQAGNYRLVAFNPVGVTTSAVAVLTVNSQAPIFSLHPTSRSAIWGGSTTFYSSASGGPAPAYQWLLNDTPISGATAPSLQLSLITPSQAGNYRVVASNAVGVATSQVAVLIVYSQVPTVSVDPPQKTVLWGDYAGSFFAYASGGPPPVLQWYRNGAPIPDATANSLYLGYVTPDQAGSYTVVASNAVGSSTSQVAVLTVVSQAPIFTSEPIDLAILWGDYASFAAFASAGPPADYQWFFNEQPLLSETNSYLDIPDAGTNAAGLYFVVATNLFGSATSRVAILTVETAPPMFLTEPDDSGAVWGQNISFYSMARGGPTPVYQWRRNGMPIAGATNNYLELFNVTTNAAGGYDVIATNFLGAVTSRVATLEVEVQAPQFGFSYVLPGEQVVEGTDVRFYGGAYGGPPPAIYLSLNGSSLALPFSQGGGFLLSEVTTNDSGRYALVASNFVGSVTSFVANLQVKPGGPLDRWTRRNPLPQGENLLAVTYGNGRFVATGERGSIVSSVNGIDWSALRIRADADLTGAAYGNGIWVCVSRAGNILTSSNAVQWLPRVLDPQLYLEGVVFAAGRFVAVGGAGENTSLVSTNGIDWVRGTATYSTRFKGVTYGNGRFVAVLDSSPSILTSTDGLEWNPSASSLSAFFEGIAFADGLFVAVGANGALFTSPDGDIWTQRVSGTTRRLIEAAHGNGRWVAVGVRGIIQSSADGITWRAETSGTPDRFEGVTFASGLFVALGENGTTLTSTNGVVWTKRNLGSTRDLDGIAIGSAGQIVAVGKFGTILTTPDGVHITERATGITNDLHGVAFGNGRYVAVGDGGSVVTSTNGSSWNSFSLGSTYYFKGVTYSNGLWVAVGTRGVIVTSTNGVDWAFQNSGVLKDLNDVVYGNGFFMVVGDSFPPNGTVFTSTDGANWFDRSIYTGKNLRGVTFANGMFLAVGNDGIIYVTSDAISWAPRTSGVTGDGRNLRNATYAEGHWIAVGNDGIIITSTNSVDWIRRAPRTVENLHGVRFVNGTFVAIGNRGTILQSGRVIGPMLNVRDFDPVFGFVFSIEAEIGRDYRLQASDDLVNWEDILEFNNTQDTTLFLDGDAMFFPLRFYRVVSP